MRVLLSHPKKKSITPHHRHRTLQSPSTYTHTMDRADSFDKPFDDMLEMVEQLRQGACQADAWRHDAEFWQEECKRAEARLARLRNRPSRLRLARKVRAAHR